jgi:hypothetical protein
LGLSVPLVQLLQKLIWLQEAQPTTLHWTQVALAEAVAFRKVNPVLHAEHTLGEEQALQLMLLQEMQVLLALVPEMEKPEIHWVQVELELHCRQLLMAQSTHWLLALEKLAEQTAQLVLEAHVIQFGTVQLPVQAPLTRV